MKKILYIIWQCTWGILQTTLGVLLLLFYCKNQHFLYHGAIVTTWKYSASVSLGMFVFMSESPKFSTKYRDVIDGKEAFERLLVHEYGHTIQSLLLGPLYLVLIGLPSMIWGYFGANKRLYQRVSYSSFFTERWADKWGEIVTGEMSIGDLVI